MADTTPAAPAAPVVAPAPKPAPAPAPEPAPETLPPTETILAPEVDPLDTAAPSAADIAVIAHIKTWVRREIALAYAGRTLEQRQEENS
jgi:hypothetical protein